LENINAIYKVSDLPILPPLIGFDKEDIIKLAKQIGTYDISIIPAQDLCSKIAHKHPITKASLEKANKIDNIHIPNLDDLPIEKIQIAP
jgi:thiamine biosynthesis protein ThiI